MNNYNSFSRDDIKKEIAKDNKLTYLFAKNKYVFDYSNDGWWSFYKDSFIKYFISRDNLCKKNQNISSCLQEIAGLRFVLRITNNELVFYTTECECNILSRVKTNYIYYDFPSENLKLEFSYANYYQDKNRNELLKFFRYFLKNMPNKGAYIYGPPGVGKTFSCMLFANKLAARNKKIMFISVPNLIMSLKKTYNDRSYSFKNLDQLCIQADILFLDDIGGELVTSWVRDELLFNILNYRLNYKKPTFFTSNYSIDDLKKIYSNIKKDRSQKVLDYNVEKIKSERLVRRISDLAFKIPMFKKNTK